MGAQEEYGRVGEEKGLCRNEAPEGKTMVEKHEQTYLSAPNAAPAVENPSNPAFNNASVAAALVGTCTCTSLLAAAPPPFPAPFAPVAPV